MSTKAFGEHVHVMNHPLVAHKLTIMRDKNTSVKDFRELVRDRYAHHLRGHPRPAADHQDGRDSHLQGEEPTLAGKKFAVVPILRAGLGLVDGVLRMVPSARVGHIGMFRDEERSSLTSTSARCPRTWPSATS